MGSRRAPGPLYLFALNAFRYSGRALTLVWRTSPALTLAIAGLTLLLGVLPAAVAYVGKLIVDAVVLAAQTGLEADRDAALRWVLLEAGVVAALAAAQRGIDVCQQLLRALLGFQVNVMILEKAVTLDLPQFEDAEFYDKLTRARREASRRPLSLVQKTFGLLQSGVSLVSYGALLWGFSPWAVAALAVAGLPAFFVEAKFSGDAFRLFSWRAPETRKQAYLEMLMAREDYAKEVQTYGLAPLFLRRYRSIFDTLYPEDRALTLRRGFWGYVLGLLSTATFYGAYGWIAWATIAGRITLGDMTMYLLLFKQGQSAFSVALNSIGKMYEDNLYLSTLYDFLGQPSARRGGGATQGPEPDAGVVFDDVSFTYPDAESPALSHVSMAIRPGEKLALVGANGSGKTTLIKLLTRLYEPTSGRILVDGLDAREWDGDALRERVAVVFQDYVRYQLTVGENVGMGDVPHMEEAPRLERAADKGMALPFIRDLDGGFEHQLGRWFHKGTELSGGQWQKIAMSRAFMREGADILVLDEPTSAMDAAAEQEVFERVRALTERQMAIIISHRFSTVRMADHIVVLQDGRIIEEGDHPSLMSDDGVYARLFTLQAQGYQ